MKFNFSVLVSFSPLFAQFELLWLGFVHEFVIELLVENQSLISRLNLKLNLILIFLKFNNLLIIHETHLSVYKVAIFV